MKTFNHLSSLKLQVYCLFVLLLISLGLFAEGTPSIEIPVLSKQLNAVDVMASPMRQPLNESYSVTVIDSSRIEEKVATSLIDVLEDVAGITKRSEYHSAIVLRGLGGKRLLITRDGNRRMGNFPGGYMGQGVNLYDLSYIEIIKGPASVIYGPGAITGIINMVRKSPFLQPGMHGRSLASFGSNNNEHSYLFGLNWANLDHALSLSARYHDADDYVYGLGQRSVNSSFQEKDLHASYSFENNKALMITVESDLHLGGPWGRPVGFNGTAQMKVYNMVDDTWHSAMTAVWKPDGLLRRMEGSIYMDKERRQQIKDSYDTGSGSLSFREEVRYKNWYGGWRGLAVLSPTEGMLLNLGTDGVLYRIDSPTMLTDYFLNTTLHNRVVENAGVGLGGLFAEVEFQPISSRFTYRVGARTDVSTIYEGNVHDTLLVAGRKSRVHSWSGTTGVVFTAFRNVFLSFQLARSCRMPDASEMFIVTSGSDGMIFGNSKLTPEYGLNLDAGLRGKIGPLTFDLSLYSNFLNDFIALEYWQNSGKKGINYTYLNVDKARIIGAELVLGAKLLRVLHPDNRLVYTGTYVCTRGDALTNAANWFCPGQPLRNIPPFNTRQEVLFRRMLTSTKSIYFGGEIMHYSAQNRIAPAAEGGYQSLAYTLFCASAGFAYRRGNQKWDIRFKGENLADNRYCPFESLVPSMGRNFKIQISLVY